MDGILVPISLFAALAFVSWAVLVSIRRVMLARVHAGVQTRLLDRLPTADSLIAYTQTEGGRAFVASLLEERAERSSPYKSILHGVQAAILFSVFGVAVLVVIKMGRMSEDALVFGVMALALGIGFALAAGATWVLSSRFGLLTVKTVR